MKIFRFALLSVVLACAGCLATTGQVVTSLDLGEIHVSSGSSVDRVVVDLNQNSDYAKHKDKLSSLADVAVLGEVHNSSGSDLNFEIWMTPNETNFTTAEQVEAGAIKLWGPFTLTSGGVKRVDWDGSAALFTAAGKTALITEAKGDGQFTLYALGAGTGTHEFTVPNAQLVIVLDAGL